MYFWTSANASLLSGECPTACARARAQRALARKRSTLFAVPEARLTFSRVISIFVLLFGQARTRMYNRLQIATCRRRVNDELCEFNRHPRLYDCSRERSNSLLKTTTINQSIISNLRNVPFSLHIFFFWLLLLSRFICFITFTFFHSFNYLSDRSVHWK